MRNDSSLLTCYVRHFQIYILPPEIFCDSCVLINLLSFSLVEVTEKQGDENKLRCIYLRLLCVSWSLFVMNWGRAGGGQEKTFSSSSYLSGILSYTLPF